MKRILTLAFAAILVVAFAIPTFAAPKVELVGGTLETEAYWNATDGWWGTQDLPVVSDLKFKFSADNFVFNATVDSDIVVTEYDFALTLPFMTLSGYFNSVDAADELHFGRSLKLASNASFQEITGFNWALYANDDLLTGPFGSFHAKVGVPVGAFTGTLEYAHEGLAHLGYISALYTLESGLYVKGTVGKEITTATDDFVIYAEVGAPIVEGWKVIGKGLYSMPGLDYNSDKWTYVDRFEGSASFRYNNEATNAEAYARFRSLADFSGGRISARGEYVNNGTLYAVSGDYQPEYATGDWNTSYDWVRANSGNDYSVLAEGDYYLTGYWNAGLRAMFAPDAAPVVVAVNGFYTDTFKTADANGDDTDETYEYVKYTVDGYLGIRINSDIHFALHGNLTDSTLAIDYTDPLEEDVVALDNEFALDAALVYSKDSVTASVTALNLTNYATAGGVELYLGISF